MFAMMPKSDLLFICEDSDYVGAGGTPDNFRSYPDAGWHE